MKGKWNKLLSFALALVLCVTTLPTALAAGTGDHKGWDKIEFFGTNDVHGYLVDISSSDAEDYQYRLAYIANAVNQARKDPETDGVLLLDGGDIYQGCPVSNANYGAAMRAAYDIMDYDAVVLGNHEFDWDVQTYAADKDGTMPAYEVPGPDGSTIKGDSDIPVLCSTLTDAATGKRVDFVKDYTVVEKAGYRIAVVGYTPDLTGSIMASKIAPYKFDDDMSKLRDLTAKVKADEKADIVVVLSHMPADAIAEAMDPKVVNLVQGGHSGGPTAETASNGIPYLYNRKYAVNYSHAEIYIEPSSKKVEVAGIENVLLDEKPVSKQLSDTPENAALLDPEIMELSRAIVGQLDPVMSEKLGYVTEELTKDTIRGSRSATANNWLGDLICAATDSVMGFTNKGGIRAEFELPDGASRMDLTYGNVFAMNPFGNELYTYELTGQQIKTLLTFTLSCTEETVRFSGCDVEYYNAMGQWVVSKATLNDGTEIDLNDNTKTYRVCATSYVGTLPYSPFVTENWPVTNEGSGLLDNESAIAELREEGKGTGLIHVDAEPHTIYIQDPVTEVSASPTADELKQLVQANALVPMTLRRDGVSVVVPQGFLTEKTDLNALLAKPVKGADAAQVTYANGTTAVVPFSNGTAYVASEPGTYSFLTNEKTYSDVPAAFWGAEAVDFAAVRDLFTVTGNDFRPNASMKLSEAVDVLGCAFGEAKSWDAWYTDFVDWAERYDIEDGDPNFKADAVVTREQFCVVLDYFMSQKGMMLEQNADVPYFNDYDTMSEWAEDSLEIAMESGLLQGKRGGFLAPQAEITRAEAAMILSRLVAAIVA